MTAYTIDKIATTAQYFTEPLAGLGDALALDMVLVPAGRFMMGSADDEPERYEDESPQHEVTIRSFFMSRYPVTQAQWRAVAALGQVDIELDPDPSHFKGDNRPVEQISWYEAAEFCKRLHRHAKRPYRLPSEAQWEYACRAGSQTPFYFGDTISPALANYRGTTDYNGGPEGEYREETTPVDYFDAANAFGLCDMHGNVWEWCADHWHYHYEGAPTDGSAWLSEDKTTRRLRRGGSWNFNPRLCRAATRRSSRPDDHDNRIGFRVCCNAPRTLQPPAD
jgi:formylglycine-generating enzyme required for sulfatase activity